MARIKTIARKFEMPILAIILATMLFGAAGIFSHIVTARAGDNMYPVAAEVGRISVYLDETNVSPGQDAILVTKNSNGSFTNQGSACPVSPDEASRWLGVDSADMTFIDTGFEKFWSYKSSTGKSKSIRVPFGSFQDYQGTWTTWSTINADAGTWRCAKAATANVKNDKPVAQVLPCPVFAGVQSYRLSDGVNCKIDKRDMMTDKVPTGWTADFWDDQQHGVRNNVPAGTTITTNEVTFKPAK